MGDPHADDVFFKLGEDRDKIDGPYIAYEVARSSYLDELKELHLVLHLDVPISLEIWKLAEQVQHRLSATPLQYTFHSQEEFNSQWQHECLGLKLLAYYNRGKGRSTDGLATMTEVPIPATFNLDQLLSDLRYTPKRHTIQDNRLVLNFGKL